MSKPSLTEKSSKITTNGSIIINLKDPMHEVWGLKNWLISLNLINCYSFLYTLDVDELMNITERRIFKMFPSQQVFKIVDSVEEVMAQKKLLIDLKRKILDLKFDLNIVFKQLDTIFPTQFTALLGPVPTFFVDAMQLVWKRLPKIKPLSVKQDHQRTFYRLCLRGELSESFMEADKEYLRKWRVAYQTERKLLKQQAKEAKK